MRLSPPELENIRKVVTVFLGSTRAELRLYGSRTDDSKKGGDIDLVLIFPDEQAKNTFKTSPHIITSELKRHLGERKIDFSIITSDHLSDPFWQLSLAGAIVLLP